MIYTCWGCGWRINSIINQLLFEHHPFCSELCINLFIKNNRRRAAVQDWYENGVWGNWKKERKVNRVRPRRWI